MKLVAILILFLTSSLLLNAQKFVVKVVGVSDGDTFTAINRDNLQLKVRLFGIDAPEKKQDFSQRSKQALSDLIYLKTIIIDVQHQDSWGRFIAYAYTDDGSDVSLKMLENGWAWHFKKYDNTERYARAEINARKKRLGLWSQQNPIPPWEYRKRK